MPPAWSQADHPARAKVGLWLLDVWRSTNDPNGGCHVSLHSTWGALAWVLDSVQGFELSLWWYGTQCWTRLVWLSAKWKDSCSNQNSCPLASLHSGFKGNRRNHWLIKDDPQANVTNGDSLAKSKASHIEALTHILRDFECIAPPTESPGVSADTHGQCSWAGWKAWWGLCIRSPWTSFHVQS